MVADGFNNPLPVSETCRLPQRVTGCRDDASRATDGLPSAADAPLQRSEFAKSATSGLYFDWRQASASALIVRFSWCLLLALVQEPESGLEIVLRPGPVERHALARVFLQRVAIGGDRLLQPRLLSLADRAFGLWIAPEYAPCDNFDRAYSRFPESSGGLAWPLTLSFLF